MYKITLRIFSVDTAQLIILLYILYLNTLGLIFQNYTDLFFVLLLSTSIYFYLLRTNWALLSSGIFLGASIAVRPVGWALLIAFISIHFYIVIKKKEFELNRILVYAGTLFFIIVFGLFSYSHFGRFEFTATTGPINLLLGANNDATGGFNSRILERGKAGFIDDSVSITYIQRGDFYKEQAINWVKENPEKWLLLATLKIFHTFAWDDISLSSLLGFNDTNFARVIRIIFTEGDLDEALPDSTLFGKFLYLIVLVISHLYYYLMLIAIALGVYIFFKKKLSKNSTNLILFFVFFTTLMIMITVGTPRYKYPVFILMLPFAASYLEMKFGFRKAINEKD